MVEQRISNVIPISGESLQRMREMDMEAHLDMWLEGADIAERQGLSKDLGVMCKRYNEANRQYRQILAQVVIS